MAVDRSSPGGYRMGPSREYVIGSALVNQYMRVSMSINQSGLLLRSRTANDGWICRAVCWSHWWESWRVLMRSEGENISQLMFVFLFFKFVCPLQKTETNRPGLRRL